MAFRPLDDEPAGKVSFRPIDAQEETSMLRRGIADPAISLLKGAISVPEAAVGLANIPTMGIAGKFAEGIGFRPKDARSELDTWYSPEQQAANKRVQDAKGFFPTVQAAVENPSVIGHTVAESVPSMMGGVAIARGLLGAGGGALARSVGATAAPTIAGAAGEGIVGTGLASEQIRQQTPTGTLTPEQLGYIGASGIGTALIGAAGGAAARKMGLSDVDTMLAGGVGTAGTRGVPARVLGGAASEGMLEEMPQSAQEQAWQNLALNKPVAEGVPEQAAIGLLSGAVMGGAGGIVPQRQAQPPGPLQKAADAAATTPSTIPQEDGVPPVVAQSSTISAGTIPQTQQPAAGIAAAVQNTPAAPGTPIVPVSTAAPPTTTTQAEPAGVPVSQPQEGTAPRGNETEITQPAEPGQQAQSAQAADSAAAEQEWRDFVATEGRDIGPRQLAVILGQFRARRRQASGIEAATGRVEDARQREVAANRMAVLESLPLTTTGNTIRRFAAALRNAGIRDYRVSPEERQMIARLIDARDTLQPLEQEPENELTLPEKREAKEVAPTMPRMDALRRKMATPGARLVGNRLLDRHGKRLDTLSAEEVQELSPKQQREPAKTVAADELDAFIKEEVANLGKRRSMLLSLQAIRKQKQSEADRADLDALIEAERADLIERRARLQDAHAAAREKKPFVVPPLRTPEQPTTGGRPIEQQATALPLGKLGKRSTVDATKTPSRAPQQPLVSTGEQQAVPTYKKATARSASHYRVRLKTPLGNFDVFVEKHKDSSLDDYKKDAKNAFAADSNMANLSGIAQISFDGAPEPVSDVSDQASVAKNANWARIAKAEKAMSPKMSAGNVSDTFPNSGSEEPKPAISKQDTEYIIRARIKKHARNMGVLVIETNSGWHTRFGEVSIPAEDAEAEGAISANHVFAHELGHAAMQKRGLSFKGFPIAETRKWIKNWDELVSASKEYRPGVWNHANKRIRAHARKPEEIIADAIASVIIGSHPPSLLRDIPGLNERDIGFDDKPTSSSGEPTSNAGNLPAKEAKTEPLEKPEELPPDSGVAADDIGAIFDKAMDDVFGEAPAAPAQPSGVMADEVTEPSITRRANPGAMQDRSFVARAFIRDGSIPIMGVGATEQDALIDMMKDADRKRADVGSANHPVVSQPKATPKEQDSFRENVAGLAGALQEKAKKELERPAAKAASRYGRSGWSAIKKIAEAAGLLTDPQDGKDSSDMVDFFDRYYNAGRLGNPMPKLDIHPNDARAAYAAGVKDKEAGLVKINQESNSRAPAAAAASAAKNAGMGLADVAKGLNALFKPKPGTLGMGLPFDEDTYAAAKPYFQAGIAHFKQAGADIAEMMKSLIMALRDQFGMDRETITAMKPYVVRFMEDAKAGKLDYDEASTAGNTDEATTRNASGTTEVQEVGSGGDAKTRRSGGDVEPPAPGANLEGVEGVSPTDAGTSGNNEPGGKVRGPDASENVGGSGKLLEGGDAVAGLPGTGGAGVADDVPGRGLGNYHVADPEALIGGSPRVRFARNKAAIETFQIVSSEGRAPTQEERDTIARFIGWGSFGQELFNGSWHRPAPKPEWKEADAWLREHLGKEEWESAQASIINAHYTDPPTVQTMWNMVRQMGFTGGRVLEPSMGIGNFFGMMPRDLMERSQLTGIEMDSLTGGMAKMLYPDANINIKPYQDSKTSDGFYDLVIGNWPFAAKAPLDRRYMRLSPTLHDYFFLKALDQTRAGGIVIGITSSGTMDKAGEASRYAIAKKADLIGAFRLPSGAFEKYAGTSVVTDILVFRKREEENPSASSVPWLKTEEAQTPQGTPVKINAYFANNPQFVLGTTNYGHGTTRGVPGMIVDRPGDMMDRLQAIPGQLPEDAYSPAITNARVSFISNHTNDRQQSVTTGPDNGLYVVDGEHLKPLHEAFRYVVKDAKKTAAREAQVRALIALRKAYASLLDAERGDEKAATIARKKLNAIYKAFVNTHGTINGSDGLNILHKVGDPFFPSLAALEVKTDQEYVPAAILSRPTMRAAKALSDPTVSDAFVLARNKSMVLDMESLAKDAGVTVAEATRELVSSGAVFKTPVGNYEVSDVYLSGNVRRKLHEAEAALKDGDADMATNIEALKKVIPPDEPYYRIEAKLGAPWISPAHYRTFVAELLGVKGRDVNGIHVENRMGRWVVAFTNPSFNRRPEAMSVWGTDSYPFSKLVRAAMNNLPVTIRVRDSDGNLVVAQVATEEANTKIANLREHFSSWVWSDIDRRTGLEKEYNEVMRAIAAPKFDGSFLGLAGMALQRGKHEFNLRQHQVDAIWRGLVNQMGIYAHEVGTGKTYTMAGLAIESRRYGLARKPLIFAHNANSASVAREFQEMYPAAKLLYIDNLSPSNIATTMRQIANDDWDAVIVPHSLIERFALTQESLDEIAREEIALLEEEAMLAAAEDNSSLTREMMSDDVAMRKVRSPTAKELVKARNLILARIARMAAQSSREDAISFEELGVDMIIVDEAHEFKKPPLVTRMKMKGLNKGTSNRSVSLRFLTDYVKKQNSGKGVHLFTGTPITNTLTEIYNLQRYVADIQMQRDGVKDWDAWFSTFADSLSDVELTSTGEYDAVTRLSTFINTADLRNMIGAYTDIVFADDMPEFKPRSTESGKTLNSDNLSDVEKDFLLNGKTDNPIGRPYKKVVNDVADMTEDQREYLATLQQRATAFKNAQPRERKRMSTEGHINAPIIIDNQAPAVGLDPRFFDLSAEDHPNLKVNRAAKNILRHYNEDLLATQVVFVERGYVDNVERTRRDAGGWPLRNSDRKPITEIAPTFNLVSNLIDNLVNGGIPRAQIAIVSGSTSRDRRMAISDEMNAGTIRVVIGMTSTLGIGVNMQKHVRAMHHLDAPWMPGDLEQRNGRGQRQGNQWNTVLEYRYITDRVDGRRWQVLAIKDRFIKQFLKANSDTRIIEGDAVSDSEGDTDIMESLSEAAGDPRIMLRQKLKKDVEQLERRLQMHEMSRRDSAWTMRNLTNEIAEKRVTLAAFGQDIEAAQPALEKGQFSITIDGRAITERQKADAAIKNFVDNMDSYRGGEQKLGSIGQFDIILNIRAGQLYGYIKGPGRIEYSVQPSVASITTTLRNLQGRAEHLLGYIKDKSDSLPRLKEAADAPFPRADVLAQKQKLLQQLEADLQQNPVPPPPWLRQGAPVETFVYVNGKPYVVEGHQHGKDGFYVIIGTPRGPRRLHYGMARDEHGMDLYEAHLFTPPVSIAPTLKKGDEVVSQNGMQWVLQAAPKMQDGVLIVLAKEKVTGSTEELRVDTLKPAAEQIEQIPLFNASRDVEPAIAASEHEQEQADQIQQAALSGALPGERQLARYDMQDNMARDSGAMPGESRFSKASGIDALSHADRAVYSMAAEGKSAQEILSFLSKASRRPFNRVLATALQKAGLQTSVTVDSQGGWSVGNRSYAQKYAAAYSPKTNKVALFTPREAERHFLHELVHAATLKAIESGGVSAMRMRALFNHVQKSGKVNGQYGMSNLDEFVAEAFTNPKFQEALKGVPAPAGSTLKSAWQWFVNIVSRVLGIRTSVARTALDRAMTIGAQLMRENAGIAAEETRYSLDGSQPFDGREVATTPLKPGTTTLMVNGTERPALNSNGKPIHWSEEGIRNFWRWFGDSKVVDAQGRPLVVYHGSEAVGVTNFDGSSLYLTSSKRLAKQYTGFEDEGGEIDYTGEVVELYVQSGNRPLEIDADGNSAGEIPVSRRLVRELDEEGELIFGGYAFLDDIATKAMDAGYSSVKVDNVMMNGKTEEDEVVSSVFVTFIPEQVKSSTGNTGAFSPTDPNIRFNLATDWQTAPTRAASTIRQYVADSMRSDSNTSWLTPFNTQYHKSARWAAEGKVRFKHVFNIVQQFIADTSRFAVMSQNAAPALLHEIKSLRDVKEMLTAKHGTGKQHRADIEAIASPLYDGTLYGGGNPLAGLKWSDSLLRTKYNLTDRQIKLYHEALAAVKVSMDEMAKSLVARHAKRVGVDFDNGMALDDMVADVAEKMKELQDDVHFEFLSDEAKEAHEADILNLMDMDKTDEARKAKSEFVRKQKDAKEKIAEIEKTIADIKAIEGKAVALQEHGYFPLMRFGRHTVTAKDAEGKTLFFGMYDGIPLVPRSGQAEANRVKREVQAMFPDATVETGIINDEKYKLYQGLNLDAMQIFAEHMDKDDLAPVQEFIRLATNSRSAMKRLMHREGTPGFDRDVRRTLAQFIVSNARSAASNYHNADMLRAAEEANKDGGDIGREAVRLVKYIQNPEEEAQVLRGFLFFQFLGGSIASAVVNLTQTPAMTLPFLSKFEPAGRLSRRLLSAAKMAVGDPKDIADAPLRDALMTAEMDGVTAPQEIHQLVATAANNLFAGSRTATVFLRGWGAPFAMAESVNRRIAFISAFKIAQGMGKDLKAKTGFATPFEFAEDAVNQTQGLYNKGNKMNVGRGAPGAIVMTFKQFSIMYLELLKRLPPKQRAIMLGVLLISAGGGGLPGVEDAEDIWDTIGQWLGFASNSKRTIRNTLTDLTNPEIADLAINGLLSKMGIDLHSRLGMQNLLPGTAMLKQSSTDKGREITEVFGPAASVIKSVGDALEKLATGQPAGAAKALVPGAIRNIWQGVEMAATGRAEDARGRATVPVNEAESVAKVIGFNPKSVAQRGEVNRGLWQDQRLIEVKREGFTADIVSAILAGDDEAKTEAYDAMRAWNEDNPQHRVTINPATIGKRVREARAEGTARMVRALPKAMRQQAAEEFAR